MWIRCRAYQGTAVGRDPRKASWGCVKRLSNKSKAILTKKNYFCSLNEQNQFYEENYPFCFGTIV